MLALMIQGVGFGFAAGTSPGPFQSFIISTTLSRGWQRGLLVIVSPLIADIPIIFVMTFLLQQLPETVLRVIQVAGGLFVLWLAGNTWKAYRAGRLVGGEVNAQPGKRRRTLAQGVTMNLLSPGPYVFWGAVTGPILIDGLSQSLWHGAAFLITFYATFLGIMAVLVLIFDRLRRLDERLTRGVLLLTIIVLALLGVGLVVQGSLR
jgi:threonine/homoserine/homoserine lactone efflux protein